MIEILVFSFLIALTGALSPGPLLTFTIYRSLKQKRGYLAGIYIILGHATIEFVLIIALLAGTTFFFHNIVFLTLVGTIGGFFLVIFGIIVIRDVSKTNFDATFTFENDKVKGFKGNSFIGGIVVSLSNPFWTFWWAVIGLGFMASFNISFENPLGILLFFIGHELGDMIFYLPLSTFVYYGGKSLNSKVYKYILIVCGAFMIIFGSYLAFNIIFNPPSI